MVTKAELVSIARKQKLPLGMIEKDFVLTLVLREIYNSRFKNTLVFKGGTALHKLYLPKGYLLTLILQHWMNSILMFSGIFY